MPLRYRNAYAGKKYLRDNFSHLDPESRYLLRFFHDAYASIPKQRRLVEIGGGGALYSLISARSRVDEMVYGECNPWGRAELKRWRRASPGSHDWREFFAETQQLEGGRESVEGMMEQLRTKLKAVVDCDIFAERCGLARRWGSRFDIVSSQFCAESISEDEHRFRTSMENLCSIVSPGGYLVISLLDRATYWDFADDQHLCASVDRDLVVHLLEDEGFHILTERHSINEITEVTEEFCSESARGHNYHGFVSLVARRAEASSP